MSSAQFAHPKMLWLLALTVPLLSLFFWWSWRKRQYLISQFVRSRLLAHLTVGLSRRVQKSRMVLLVLAVACLLTALARPQWGFAWEEAHQAGLDVVVAVDTSRSMLAEDIAPNRLERAKLAALDLMRLASRDRLGLVAFAGTAFLQCPLTVDEEAFRQSVDQLTVGIIPQGGTALAEAIETAQGAFKDGDNHRVLVIFTDGEDHDSGALEAAEQAAAAGLRIFTVGVGTPTGELLRVRDAQGELDYIKDTQGNVVKSRLNEMLLTQIATAANGFYVAMAGASTVDVLYQRGLEPLPRSESSTKLVRQYNERFQWPLGLAILLLIAELFLPERRRVQRTEPMIEANNPELRKLVAMGVISLLALPAFASPASALRKYEEGRYKDAYQEFSKLAERRPDDVRLQYNAGAAAYKSRMYDEAAERFLSASRTWDLSMQQQARFNRGNSLYRMGEQTEDLSEKVQTWEDSAKEFEMAAKLDPFDADAKANLVTVKEKLKELKKQQQQPQNQPSEDKKEGEEKNKDGDKKQDQQGSDESKDSESKSEREKDRSQPDQNGEEKKPGEDQPKPEQPGQSEQDKGKGDQDKQGSHPTPEEPTNPEQTNSAAAANGTPAGQMSPEQVKQLLDAQKQNEKAMIFLPKEKLKANSPIVKDW